MDRRLKSEPTSKNNSPVNRSRFRFSNNGLTTTKSLGIKPKIHTPSFRKYKTVSTGTPTRPASAVT